MADATPVNGFETLSVERQEDLLFVRLDSPERANALSPATIDEVVDVYSRDWLGQGVRAVLLSGALGRLVVWEPR